MIPSSADHRGASACEAVRAQTFAACDHELSCDEVAAIDAHLVTCESCRSRVLADATFHRVLRAATALETAPPALHDRILLSLTTRTTVNAPA